MSSLEERIAAAEQRLKALKSRQVRAATRQRTRDARQHRRDDLRRKVLVGSVVLELVERGEVEISLLAGWLKGALSREEDQRLFLDYWEALGRPGVEIAGAGEGESRLPGSNGGSGRTGREMSPDS